MVDVIVRAARTGKIGDGKVWSTDGRNGGPGPHGRARSGSPVTDAERACGDGGRVPGAAGSAAGPDRVTGPARRRALARLTDGWLGELSQEAGINVGGVALVAVGGYGRGELSPFSDLDLVLLHSTETPASYAGMLAERLWYPIWDSKIRLDHSVRSVGGARQIARTDLPAMLGMLDLRHIAGDPELAATLHRRVLTDWRADAKTRLPALLASCQERAERSGELAFATAPDLKESRGGLRDLVVMRAVAASWVADCPHQGLEEARSALLDVRDAVQSLAGRATDRLQVQDQDTVAQVLGLDDRDVLLRHVASIARTVAHASDLTWHRVNRALHASSGTVTDLGGRFARRIERSPLADGIVEQDGEAVLARGINPATDPTLAVRAAAAAAQAGLPVSPATVHAAGQGVAAAARAVAAGGADRAPGAARLRRGDDPRLGGPRPGRADLEAAARLGAAPLDAPARSDPPLHRRPPSHADRGQRLGSRAPGVPPRPAAAGRAAPRHRQGALGRVPDHSEAGAALVGAVAPPARRAGEDDAVITTLIRHHLLLADTAARRDPDDPATIAALVAVIPDAATLDLLHALTVADATAAGPAAWSTWKAGQVTHLVSRVRRALAGEPPAEPPAMTQVERELVEAGGVGIVIEDAAGRAAGDHRAPDRPGLLATSAAVLTMHRMTVRTAAARTVGPTALQTWTVAPQFGDPPAAAALRTDLVRALDGSLDVAARLARRGAPARRGEAAPPAVRVIDGASDTATVIEVRAHDAPGLLYSVPRRSGRAVPTCSPPG